MRSLLQNFIYLIFIRTYLHILEVISHIFQKLQSSKLKQTHFSTSEKISTNTEFNQGGGIEVHVNTFVGSKYTSEK